MIRILPTEPFQRRLTLQALLFSIGSGTLLSMNAIFFLKYAQLTPTIISFGGVATLVITLLLGPRLGRIADNSDPRRLWALAALVEGLVYFAFPFVRHAPEYFGLLALNAAFACIGSAARTVYVFSSLPSEDRLEMLAYQRSSLNLGMTLGSGLAALILLAPSRDWLVTGPLVAGTIMLVNAFFVGRLPHANPPARPHGKKRSVRLHDKKGSVRPARDVRFMAYALLSGGMESVDALISVAFPLWIAQKTDIPQTLIAVGFMGNALVVALGQVHYSRLCDTMARIPRQAVVAGLLVGGCCVAAALSRTLPVAVATVSMLVAYALLTLAELRIAAFRWTLLVALTPDHRSGEFQSIWRSVGQALRTGAAPAFTLVVLGFTTTGWLAIAVAYLAIAVALAARVRSDLGRGTSTAVS